MKTSTKIILSTAVAGLVAFGAAAPKVFADDAAGGAKKAGCNECKGKGACKTDKNACKGHNACKGQGGCCAKDEHKGKK